MTAHIEELERLAREYQKDERSWHARKLFISASNPAAILGLIEQLSAYPADWRKDSSLETWFPFTAEQIRKQEAEISRLREFGQWQPIDTAPKDGRTVLLGYFNAHDKWRTLRAQWMTQEEIDEWEDPDSFAPGWFETSVEADDAPSCWPTSPTHWMPLPPAPEKENG